MIREEMVELLDKHTRDCEGTSIDVINQEAADRILALLRGLVNGNKLVVCGNMDYQNGYNRALDDLLSEMK